MALKLRFGRLVRCHAHDMVRRLMELSSLETRLAALTQDGETTANVVTLIESLRDRIAVGVLIRHDRMRLQGRHSVAEVRHGLCARCHLAPGVGSVAALRRGELRSCGNCGRYLYMVEDEGLTECASALADPVPASIAANPASNHGR